MARQYEEEKERFFRNLYALDEAESDIEDDTTHVKCLVRPVELQTGHPASCGKHTVDNHIPAISSVSLISDDSVQLNRSEDVRRTNLSKGVPETILSENVRQTGRSHPRTSQAQRMSRLLKKSKSKRLLKIIPEAQQIFNGYSFCMLYHRLLQHDTDNLQTLYQTTTLRLRGGIVLTRPFNMALSGSGSGQTK